MTGAGTRNLGRPPGLWVLRVRSLPRMADGTTKSYGSPNDGKWDKLWSSIRSARDNTPPPCGIEAASAHTRCAWAAQQSMAEIAAFPPSLIRIEGPAGARRTSVDGLAELLERCYESYQMPNETGVAWATPGREVSVIDKVAI